ncbi:MAG: DUF115 domain-containing protein [Candidatus Auribacterota bacterium]|jgi:hypothetical protein|nr:DUF115 domain-containing protein [Candidatus Auribacterota bacterium]
MSSEGDTQLISARKSSGFFAGNIDILRQKQPDIIDDLITAFHDAGSPHNDVVTIISKTGVPVVKVGDITVHSLYDPIKEAQRFVSSLQIDPYINIAIQGLGMGYHLDEIIAQSGNRDFILIIEKDIRVFKAFLEQRDLSGIYAQLARNCKLYFAIGRTPIELFRALQGMALTIFANGITVINHPASIKLDIGYYTATGMKVKDIFQWARVNTISQINASEDFASNIFANMPEYLRLPGIKRLFDIFKGFPGIVVSAGPSLIKNIRYLRAAQGKALIIAVDTAFKVLLGHGIEPDMVVSIDYTKHNERYFVGVEDTNAALVVDPEVYPGILRRYTGPKFMISLPGKSLCDWLALNVEDKGGMEKGLSVAHTAFLLAGKLGLSPVGFVGQDLSFPGKMTHVRGSAMVRRSSVQAGQQDTVQVQDIFGGTVLTTTSMNVFLRHFEELIDQYKGEYYDLTEGGALMAGAKPMPIKEFLMTKTGLQLDTKQIIRDAFYRPVKCDYEKLIMAVRSALSGLRQVAKVSEEGKKVVQNLERRVNKQATNYNLRKLFEQWMNISKELHSFRDVFVLLGNNITDVMVLQARNSSFDFDSWDEKNPDGLLKFLSKEKTVFTALHDRCEEFMGNFLQLQKYLENEVARR